MSRALVAAVARSSLVETQNKAFLIQMRPNPALTPGMKGPGRATCRPGQAQGDRAGVAGYAPADRPRLTREGYTSVNKVNAGVNGAGKPPHTRSDCRR
jgi:hypothetical protein